MKSPIVPLSRSDERKSSQGAKRDLTAGYKMARFDWSMALSRAQNCVFQGKRRIRALDTLAEWAIAPLSFFGKRGIRAASTYSPLKTCSLVLFLLCCLPACPPALLRIRTTDALASALLFPTNVEDNATDDDDQSKNDDDIFHLNPSVDGALPHIVSSG